MANVNVKIDLGGVKQKLSHQNMARGRMAFSNQALLDMDQFVPKRSRDLRASGHVTAGGDSIQYTTPYARTQFYGTGFRKGTSYVIKNYHTPGTGKRWDLRATAKYSGKWTDAFMKGAGLNH